MNNTEFELEKIRNKWQKKLIKRIGKHGLGIQCLVTSREDFKRANKKIKIIAGYNLTDKKTMDFIISNINHSIKYLVKINKRRKI